ncbi:MAG: XdhC family protein [Hyphomicrobium sp.]|uniref:XdhC family protein n=1 Tax=Hyphomicrobium sp. CS1BSMeth3 TaxID=1892844 RepID=UPI00092FEF4D|nr:XdhC/CoxI family protein [Hyphomicrobium sp. CS1BSMeth3]MBN9260650.1 XdhC family protein [Hyphomicrobium sp.]MBN9263449.1 XdhC family protein [Hyphomicrobium sp.]MBN9278904.1 XdhC family protein [Hyphomicrobium sp.]
MTVHRPIDVLEEIRSLRASGEPFAVATVVRTISLTAAKAGAKALIRSDGTMSAGWIGGGCARAAVLKAARAALGDGKPRLVSVQPGDALQEHGVEPGESKDGIEFARNMCPSQGTMDVFVEPILPKPELVICGASPVAVALADLGGRLGFLVTVAAPAEDHSKFGETDVTITDYDLSKLIATERYIVVATQGRGDEAALMAALSAPARHVAFVGSHRKAAALRASLATKGADAERLAAMHSPAGIDIGAVTPEEIALSILTEIVELRRRGQRRSISILSSSKC